MIKMLAMPVGLAQRTKTDHQPEPNFRNDIDRNTHNAIDRVILYYQSNNISPKFSLSGSPLDIVSDLASQMKQSLPPTHQKDAETVLNYMIREFIAYCREVQSKSLSVTFAFEKGFVGIKG